MEYLSVPVTDRHILVYYLLYALFREKQSAKLIIMSFFTRNTCNTLCFAKNGASNRAQTAKIKAAP